MNNAEKFKSVFGLYATELWAMSEESFLSWLNLVDERKKFFEACRMCSECDIFNKCQEENRNYCEKKEMDNETD